MNTRGIIETRLPEFLEKPEVLSYIKDFYRKEGKESYPAVAIPRWRRGTHFPPVEVMIGIARTANTNLAYILGLTDVNCPCELDCCEFERTLDELLSIRGMSEKDLVKRLDWNYQTLQNFKKCLPVKRVKGLIKLSEAINLSVDYILGYTRFETWELCSQMRSPFENIKRGSAAYVLADKSVRSLSEIAEAIDKDDGRYCLLSPDGKFAIFSNGMKISVNDDVFKGSYIASVKPEVE